MRIFTTILLIFFLIGCYTSKKAERQLNKAQIYHPEIVAQKTSLWYPCERFKGTSDSSQYKSFIQQIDSLNRLKIDSIFFTDTLNKIDTFVKFKDCDKILTKYRTIYKSVPAIHDTVILVSEADKYTIKYLENEREEAHKKYDRSTKLNIWLLIALIVSILLHLFRSKL